jgi:SAM-dependent methyltransferase
VELPLVSIYGAAFARVYDREWDFWAEHLWPFLTEQLGPGCGAWLDLCCGGGHLLQRACQAGHWCVGLDRSPHQLAFARRNAPTAQLILADVRAFEFRLPFDVLTCVFDSLNYLLEPAELAGVFVRVRRHMTGNGRFIFDLNTFEGLEDAWNRTGRVPCQEAHVRIDSSFAPQTGLGRAVMTGYPGEEEHSPTFVEEHTERGYRRGEVEAMLREADFIWETFDGHSLQAPEPRSARLLWVCRRGHRARLGGT